MFYCCLPTSTDSHCHLPYFVGLKGGEVLHLRLFLFGFLGASIHFHIKEEILKWQTEQGMKLESAFKMTSNICICCRDTYISALAHKDMICDKLATKNAHPFRKGHLI